MQKQSQLNKRLLSGVIGGVAGGLVFGVMMAMMGMLGMIASMLGADSSWVGSGIHMMMSIVIGLGYAILLGSSHYSTGRAAIFGALYGSVWWVMGPLIMIPIMTSEPLFALTVDNALSLMGHLVYGVILALFVNRHHTV